MRKSLYWDDFNKRIDETVSCIKNNKEIPVRRVAIFITERCNFRCKYCKSPLSGKTLSKEKFQEVVSNYGDSAILHITGGEPSTIKWLYPYLEEHSSIRFHLNTNAFIPPPTTVKRLKVSLDSCNEEHWNELVGRDAFKVVVENIKKASKKSITSITYTLNHTNLNEVVDFIKFSNVEFPDLYALFFSIYKGEDPRFTFTQDDIELFFNEIRPQMVEILGEESNALLSETLDEKLRLTQGVRFPETSLETPCYISLSERVISPSGDVYRCSHLYRDNIKQTDSSKHQQCLYGCNRRLVAFNEEVERLLK